MIPFLVLMFKVATAADEMTTFGVDDYSGVGECGGAGDDLAQSEPFSDAFLYHFSAWVSSSTWDTTRQYLNAAVDPEDVTDYSLQSWGDDEDATYGADAADVGHIATHGNAECDASTKYYFEFGMGQEHSGQDCWPEARDPANSSYSSRDVLFGDGDLDLVYFDACNSVQHCTWNGGVFDSVAGSSGSGNHLELWAGFHGLSYDDSAQVNPIKAFVFWSKNEGAGDNWINERYKN